MKTMDQADVRFLRCILFVLIVSTITTGGVVSYTSVKIGETDQLNSALPILAAKTVIVELERPNGTGGRKE